MYHSQKLEEKVATSQNQDQDEFVNLSPLFQHGSLTTGMNSLPRPLHSCSDVLTDAGWITSCPRSITDVLAGTHVVYTQCVAIVTSVGGSCSYDGWSSWWLVAHHAIGEGQNGAVINYRELIITVLQLLSLYSMGGAVTTQLLYTYHVWVSQMTYHSQSCCQALREMCKQPHTLFS